MVFHRRKFRTTLNPFVRNVDTFFSLALQNVTDEMSTNNLPRSLEPVLELVDQQKHSELVKVPYPVDQTQEWVLNDDVMPKTKLVHGTEVDLPRSNPAMQKEVELLRQIRDM